jgi:hypothetical protein
VKQALPTPAGWSVEACRTELAVSATTQHRRNKARRALNCSEEANAW